jgi:hypothetical protein
VGLPVFIEVSETGSVTYHVDTSESSVAIWDDETNDYNDVQRLVDQRIIEADHARRWRGPRSPFFGGN